MISLRFDQLAALLDGTLHNTSSAAVQFFGVSIDSRTLLTGQLFVAVRGERSDGHDYIDAALKAGAAGLVVRNTFERQHQIEQSIPVVTVADTNIAFRELAIWYRDQINPRRLGVSGSNGKTTTKEMSARLLEAVEQRAYASPGNLNNLFGAPLAFFGMPSSTRAAVIEMGVSLPGEMAELVEIVRPHAAVITNVAASHLEYLGSLDGVLAEELTLMRSVNPGPIVVAEELADATAKIRGDIVTFGLTPTADVHPSRLESDEQGRTLVTIGGHQFVINLFGQHQVLNLLAAYAGIRALGYSFDGVDTASIRFSTAPLRGEIERIGDWQVIVDCYNANPASMESGLTSLATVPARRRVAILGDMRELGRDEVRYHRDLGQFASEIDIDLLITIGGLAAEIASGAISSGMSKNIVHSFTSIDTARDIVNLLQPGDIIYLKGSRGAALERLLPYLRRETVAA